MNSAAFSELRGFKAGLLVVCIEESSLAMPTIKEVDRRTISSFLSHMTTL